MVAVVVTGARDWPMSDRGIIWLALDEAKPDLVIVGCADGADRIARDWCDYHRVSVAKFFADWQRLGRVAGPARNGRMVGLACDLMRSGAYEVTALAFPCGVGRGTRGCIALLEMAGIPIKVTEGR